MGPFVAQFPEQSGKPDTRVDDNCKKQVIGECSHNQDARFEFQYSGGDIAAICRRTKSVAGCNGPWNTGGDGLVVDAFADMLNHETIPAEQDQAFDPFVVAESIKRGVQFRHARYVGGRKQPVGVRVGRAAVNAGDRQHWCADVGRRRTAEPRYVTEASQVSTVPAQLDAIICK